MPQAWPKKKGGLKYIFTIVRISGYKKKNEKEEEKEEEGEEGEEEEKMEFLLWRSRIGGILGALGHGFSPSKAWHNRIQCCPSCSVGRN